MFETLCPEIGVQVWASRGNFCREQVDFLYFPVISGVSWGSPVIIGLSWGHPVIIGYIGTPSNTGAMLLGLCNSMISYDYLGQTSQCFL